MTETKITDEDIERYKRICSHETPYPCNYMRYYNPGMAVLIGMMIEKEMLKL